MEYANMMAKGKHEQMLFGTVDKYCWYWDVNKLVKK